MGYLCATRARCGRSRYRQAEAFRSVEDGCTARQTNESREICFLQFILFLIDGVREWVFEAAIMYG